jgi:hypothetical protein
MEALRDIGVIEIESTTPPQNTKLDPQIKT